MTKHQLTAQEAAQQAAFEAGADYFREDREADMTTIHRRASNIYPDSKDSALAYAYGYLAARLKHEEFLREKRQP
jgi:hypothetical protein